jgi:hypothetical protein
MSSMSNGLQPGETKKLCQAYVSKNCKNKKNMYARMWIIECTIHAQTKKILIKRKICMQECLFFGLIVEAY